jgi:hypothetical protein
MEGNAPGYRSVYNWRTLCTLKGQTRRRQEAVRSLVTALCEEKLRTNIK